MSLQNDEKQLNKPIEQNNYLYILLWVFPLLLLNIGWFFSDFIDHRWKEQERIYNANQDVEKLSAKSDISYCFSSVASNFKNRLKSDTEVFGDNSQEKVLISHIGNNVANTFKPPFPKYDIAVFKLEKTTNNPKILFSNSEDNSKNDVLKSLFRLLVETKSDSLEENEELLNNTSNISENDIKSFINAKNQRGKASNIFYKLKSCWFLWDYFTNENTENLYGFFIFFENSVETYNFARLLAISELKNNQKDTFNPQYAAFIPLFPDYGGVIASEELSKKPELSLALESWIPKNIKELADWQKNGLPSNKINSLNNYQPFFHVAPNQSHASVLFVPTIEKSKMPIWLIVLNVIVLSIIIIVLLRGFIFNKWFNISLRVRFITAYFLAACLPLGLLSIGSYGYISEYQHTAVLKNQSRLKLCIGQFDNKKTQAQEEYKKAFLEIQTNDALANALKKLNNANKTNNINDKNLISANLDVVTAFLNILNKNGRNIPVTSFSVIDEYGNCLSNIGNQLCLYYKTYDNQEYFGQSDKTKIDFNKTIFNPDINLNFNDVLSSLRKQIINVGTDKKQWSELQNPIFYDDSKEIREDLNENIENNYSHIITKQFDDNYYSNFCYFISLEGVPRFAITINWDESILDEESFTSCIRNFGINEPNFIFAAYKANSQGIKIWPDKFDRHMYEIKDKSTELIKQAYFKQNTVSYHDEKISAIAVPSKKYKDLFFVGAVYTHNLEIDVFYRFWICIIVIIIALIILFICIHYSSIIFLKPIIKLKSLLDQISDGNYDIELKSNSKDEFGLMCREFSAMTQELSEKKKLASLISDHAIEALSKNKQNEEVSNAESFKGTFLVCDIRNFTKMCEKHEPNQITELLNKHFAQLTKIISSNGGRIYKYIGDAVEAVFADNDDTENSSAERALTTSYKILKSLEKINEERRNKNLFEYNIGVGLCYGDMTSGTIGSIDTRLDYAIIGNILNQANKLESISSSNPEFPMIVNNAFKEYYNKKYPDVEFIKVENDKETDAFKLSNEGLLKIEDKINNNSQNNETLTESFDQNESENKVKIYEIEEDFSFRRKFIPGLVFIITLAIIMASGIYFVFTTANNNERLNLYVKNSRHLDQILCDKNGKTTFDIVCRNISLSFQNKIDKIGINDIKDESITNLLNESIKENIVLDNIVVNRLFVKLDSFSEINTTDKTFIDKIVLRPIANEGYSNKDSENICNTFKLVSALNALDGISNKLYLSEKDSEKFKESARAYMNEKYAKYLAEVFGDKLTIDVFKNNARNATIESMFSGTNNYIFWFDYHEKESNKLIGYLLISTSLHEVKKSLPMLLNAYSKDGTLISLKNKNTGKWTFSSNVSESVKRKVLHSDSFVTKSKEENIKYLGNEYLYSLLGVTNKGILDIDGTPYELYLTKLCSLNLGNPRNALIWVFIIILATSLVLWRTSQGTSMINKSIQAKLWVTLLIVAVIPVISVFFVFGLFRIEYYSVKSSAKRSEMQYYSDQFEQKSNFSSPLVWNYIRKKNNSDELLNALKTINDNKESGNYSEENLKNMGFLIDSWLNERKPWEGYETSLVNFNINNVLIFGNKDWKYSLNKNNKEISNLNNSLNAIFEEVANNILKKDKRKGNAEDIFLNKDDLKSLQKVCGNDFYLKLINGINNPTYFNMEERKLGVMISAIPSLEKSEGVIVWVIDFDNYTFLKKLSEEINSNYQVYFAEKTKYGDICSGKANNWRILLGKLASFISFSDLPISTDLKLKEKWFFIEGKASYQNPNALVLVSLSEESVLQEVHLISTIFYLLLGISLLIIIHTTRKIAEDIINPINSMVMAIQEVNKENFAYRINSNRDDELGDLCNSFDKMVKGLEEKRMMSHMLSDTAKKYTLKEGILSKKSNSVLIYIGIPDFSSLIISSNNAEVFEKLRKQTDIVSKIIIEEGGEIDKIISDKLLAVFPIEQDENTIAKSACMAAKRLIELENTNRLPLKISIGINYGTVINGFIGVGNKRDFTVIGDAVNVSARIESLAEKLNNDRCLISESCYKLVEKAFKADIYGKVELKGKSEPMNVYQLS